MSSNILREKIAEIIRSADGNIVTSWDAAEDILALPEIAEALAISEVALELEQKAAKLNLGHSIKVR